MFVNPGQKAIEDLLHRVRVIAIIGASDDAAKPSHHVAAGLQRFGYRIVPINPTATRILGEPAWPDLETAMRSAGPIDLVDVFRRPEHVPGIVDDCIRLGVKALWLQEGVVNPEAAQKARNAGIFTVMDRCVFKTRSAMAAAGT